MNQLTNILLEAIKILAAGVVGGLIGAKANDKFTRARERDASIIARRRDFLRFLETWRADIEHIQIKGGYPVVAEVYMAKLSQFKGLAATVLDCFGDTPEFEHRVNAFGKIDVSSLTPLPDRGKESLLKNLQPLMNIVRNAAGATPFQQPSANDLLSQHSDDN